MTAPLSWWSKVMLSARIWVWFLRLRHRLRTRPLPVVVSQLRPGRPTARYRLHPAHLSGIVRRSLRLRRGSRRCLPSSLVLFRLLAEQGDHPQLVVGLPRRRNQRDAHAWLELDGVQLGPAPAVERHEELARYG